MRLHGVYVISENPIVLIGADRAYPILVRLTRDLPSDVHFIRIFTWSQRRFIDLFKIKLTYRNKAKLVVHHACNDLVEYRRFQTYGFNSVWFNHNAGLPEATFTPNDTVEKRFDAVYNARILPYKRLHLASSIANLRLITGTDGSYREAIEAQGCGHAHVNDHYLSREEVVDALRECRCGLALSAIEGAMFASTEYLLCGLPVISTPSIGGRDVWFDDYNSVVVDPNPKSVADAVQRIIGEARDPLRIRAVTLERMSLFRQRLTDYVNERIAGKNVVSSESLFGDGFGMMTRFVGLDSLRTLLNSYDGQRFCARHLIGE